MIHYYKRFNSLIDFKNRKGQIAILKRNPPKESELFFKKLCQFPFFLSGYVRHDSAKEDIRKLLKYEIPKHLQFDSFYEDWLEDMGNMCEIFCSMQLEDSLCFWLGSKRGCKRYHVDMVPYRLLVTYAGEGTEILPNDGANRKAFVEGKSNDEILKDKSTLKYTNKWDIAIFRGGKKGILHRTPDSALDGGSSILMRLDYKSFLSDIKKINGTI